MAPMRAWGHEAEDEDGKLFRERERGEDEATSIARRLKAGVEAKLISGFNYKDWWNTFLLK